MEKLLQTRPDNCWQTCVAILLGCPVESLPAQHEFEKRDDYGRALRVYLDKHHGVTYVEIALDAFASVPAEYKKQHVMIGECSRTTPKNDIWHAVVGSYGEMIWDVSSTQSGLTKLQGYGLLISTPPEWRATWAETSCVCPACADCRAVA